VKLFSLDAKKIISRYLVREIRFPKSRILEGYTRLVPYLSILLFALSFFQPSATFIFVLFTVFNLLLSIGFGKYINVISADLNKGGSFLESYVPAIKKIEERHWESLEAQELQGQIEKVAGMPVSQAIERLSVLLNRLDAR